MERNLRILVLGHRGMLGNAVFRFINQKTQHIAQFIEGRYPENGYIESLNVKRDNIDAIINCVGAIPQKKPSPEYYRTINIELPQFLDSLGIPIIYPTTDCEFSGTQPFLEKYSKTSIRNATDEYGLSKATASAWIERHGINTKIIRTSIIGHELKSAVSLLDWFLSQKNEVFGYTNHYWNGITTLEWAKRAVQILEHWADAPILTQLASPECLSKYDLLKIIQKIYKKDIYVIPHSTRINTNKCLVSDLKLPSMEEQLIELHVSYNKQ